MYVCKEERVSRKKEGRDVVVSEALMEPRASRVLMPARRQGKGQGKGKYHP
jgi:hypothetical protein